MRSVRALAFRICSDDASSLRSVGTFVAIGVGIMLAVSSGKPTLSEEIER